VVVIRHPLLLAYLHPIECDLAAHAGGEHEPGPPRRWGVVAAVKPLTVRNI
jgi:hypothetical protein